MASKAAECLQARTIPYRFHDQAHSCRCLVPKAQPSCHSGRHPDWWSSETSWSLLWASNLDLLVAGLLRPSQESVETFTALASQEDAYFGMVCIMRLHALSTRTTTPKEAPLLHGGVCLAALASARLLASPSPSCPSSIDNNVHEPLPALPAVQLVARQQPASPPASRAR
jgi:hypothetical protein